jgi:peptide/nickel transport system substrate-binding protein
MTGVEVVKASTPVLSLLVLSLTGISGCPAKGTAPDALSRAVRSPSTPDPWPAPSTSPRQGGSLVIRLRTEPPHLNLLIHPDHALARVTLHQVFEALLREDPRTYELAPELAESWRISEDRRTVTFHLRGGARWHDGLPVTAADAKFTLEAVLDRGSAATALRASVKDLRAVEAPDARTVVLRYAEPHYHALHALTGIPILPKHVYGTGDLRRHPRNRMPIGSGPYRVGAWTPGREIVLHRWGEHWARGGYLDELRYRVVREDAVALLLVRRGELDLDERAGNDEWLQAADDEALRARARRLLSHPPGYAFRAYNTRHPALADRRVRLALTLLSDRPTAIREVHRGLHRPAVGPYPLESPCHDPALAPHPFDPARARTLLGEAGYGEKNPLRLTWLIPSTSKTLIPEARIFQADARPAGVLVALETVDWATFQTRLRAGGFELAALAWMTGVEDDPFPLFHSSQAQDGLNYGAYRNPEMDRLLEAARREFDPRGRRALCRRIERTLHEDQPYTFLYQLAAPIFVSRRVDGLYPSLTGLQYRDFWLRP